MSLHLPNEVIIQILLDLCEQVVVEKDLLLSEKIAEYLLPIARTNSRWHDCVAYIFRTHVKRIHRTETETTLTAFLKHHIRCTTDPLTEMTSLKFVIDAKGRFRHSYFGGRYQSWYMTSPDKGGWVSYDGVTYTYSARRVNND